MGIDYEQLPESYVIFICDFDPIGLGKYKYTRRQVIEEDRDYDYDDGSYTVFLSTVGLIQERRSVLAAECESVLLTFLSAHSCNPPEAFLEIMFGIAPVSENLKERILSIKTFEDVMQLTVKAAKANSLESFEKELEKMGY